MNAPGKALLTGMLLLRLWGVPAAALCGELPAETEAPAAPDKARYTFQYGIEAFDRRLQAIFEALGSSYAMGEEPNIQGAYEYHLPNNVYAKTLSYEGKIEYVLLFLPMENSADQGALWQYGAFMAAAAGDISAADWAQLLLKASALTLDTAEMDLWLFAAGNTIMICQTDPEAKMLYVIIEREENERDEPMDGSFQTG